MKTRLFIEASVLEQDRPSGVNYLTSGLASELERLQNEEFEVGYFWLNFLRKKAAKNSSVQQAKRHGRLQQIWYIPQRVYAKLIYYRLALPLPIHRANWLLYPNFYLWPTLGRSKKAVIIHDLCYLRYPEYVEDKNRAFLDRVATQAIKKADLVLADSQFIADEIIDLTETPREKIHVLGVPVESSDFDASQDKGFVRLTERYNIKKPFILSFGTLEPRKNLVTLVEAYCALPVDIRKQFSLVLAGKWGWKVESLRELIERKRQDGFDIITTDYVDHGDRATFYRNASFYVITTHYEGFGMPLLEALHCGIPTVAVDIPVLREVGGDACLWAKKETSDVTEKLTELIKNPELAQRLSKLGPIQSSHFTWKETAKKLVDRLTSKY